MSSSEHGNWVVVAGKDDLLMLVQRQAKFYYEQTTPYVCLRVVEAEEAHVYNIRLEELKKALDQVEIQKPLGHDNY